MSRYALSHLSDRSLLDGLARLVARDRATTAEMLAHIAEVDARKLYLPAAYPSMYAYCVGELRLSEDAAFKRIKAARAARRFPVILEMVADGRLHLSAVVLLAPHLTEDTCRELLAAAAHNTRAEIEQLLAARFPTSDMLAWVAAIPADGRNGSAQRSAPCPGSPAMSGSLAMPAAESSRSEPAAREERALMEAEGGCLSAIRTAEQAPGPVRIPQVVANPRVRPLTSMSFSVQFTLSHAGHEQLRRAQELLGHTIPSGDIAAVMERALGLLVAHLERQKFAATDRPRPAPRRESANPRHIPAHVKRAVWARDGARCTFVSDDGRRCESRTRLEFDHVLEVARGGGSSESDLRLRCRAHNQYTAGCTFGEGFMEGRRAAPPGASPPRSASGTSPRR